MSEDLNRDCLPTKWLICTVGLPRSGKSTWSRQQGFPIVNPDSIRLAMHGQRFYGPAEPFVWATAKLMVRSLFLAGHDTVILDSTMTTEARREEWISREWQTKWMPIVTDVAECLRRLDDGDTELGLVINRMAAEIVYPTQDLWMQT